MAAARPTGSATSMAIDARDQGGKDQGNDPELSDPGLPFGAGQELDPGHLGIAEEEPGLRSEFEDDAEGDEDRDRAGQEQQALDQRLYGPRTAPEIMSGGGHGGSGFGGHSWKVRS